MYIVSFFILVLSLLPYSLEYSIIGNKLLNSSVVHEYIGANSPPRLSKPTNRPIMMIPDPIYPQSAPTPSSTPFCSSRTLHLKAANPFTELHDYITKKKSTPKYQLTSPFTSTDVMAHILKYPGAKIDIIRSQAFLKDPSKLEFANSHLHFLSCWDARSSYAIMGTPGGDIAEFLLALAVLEMRVPLSHGFTFEQVTSYFESFLSNMEKKGRKQFYMHTDGNSLKEWARVANVENPLAPKNVNERKALVDAWGYSIGCNHIRNILANGTVYNCRPSLVAHLIRAFLNIYLDKAHPLNHLLLFPIVNGLPGRERAIVNILGPIGPSFCTFRHPLIVPSHDELHSIIVYHPGAVYEFRAQLAQFIGEREKMTSDEISTLFHDINKLGLAQMQLTKSNSLSGEEAYESYLTI